jgi:hypothetical protein
MLQPGPRASASSVRPRSFATGEEVAEVRIVRRRRMVEREVVAALKSLRADPKKISVFDADPTV